MSSISYFIVVFSIYVSWLNFIILMSCCFDFKYCHAVHFFDICIGLMVNSVHTSFMWRCFLYFLFITFYHDVDSGANDFLSFYDGLLIENIAFYHRGRKRCYELYQFYLVYHKHIPYYIYICVCVNFIWLALWLVYV